MITKSKNRSLAKPLRKGLAGQFAALLAMRSQGLINQIEYEQRLEEISFGLPPRSTLVETDLQDGGTRFVVRESDTGAILEVFEFWRAYDATR
ncbi:MAG: hypothetical protein WCO56_16135 [Verrucomicrobiota bacterium]